MIFKKIGTMENVEAICHYFQISQKSFLTSLMQTRPMRKCIGLMVITALSISDYLQMSPFMNEDLKRRQ